MRENATFVDADRYVGIGRTLHDDQGRNYTNEFGGIRGVNVGDIFSNITDALSLTDTMGATTPPLPFTADVIARFKKTADDVSRIENKVGNYPEPWKTRARDYIFKTQLLRERFEDARYWYDKATWNGFAEDKLSRTEKRVKEFDEQYLPFMDAAIRAAVGLSPAETSAAAQKTTDHYTAQKASFGQFFTDYWYVFAGGAVAVTAIGILLGSFARK